MIRYSVLIVDDDHRWCIDMLNALEDYPCLKALPPLHNGRAAIDHITLHRPDIIILDLIMPEFDGLYVIGIIREIESYDPFIYVVSPLGYDMTNQILRKVDVNYYSIRPIQAKAVARNVFRLVTAEDESGFSKPDADEVLENLVHNIMAALGAPMYLISTKTTSAMIKYCVSNNIDTSVCSLQRVYHDVVKYVLPNATVVSLERNTRSVTAKLLQTKQLLFQKLFPDAEKKLSNTEFYYTVVEFVKTQMKEQAAGGMFVYHGQ